MTDHEFENPETSFEDRDPDDHRDEIVDFEDEGYDDEYYDDEYYDDDDDDYDDEDRSSSRGFSRKRKLKRKLNKFLEERKLVKEHDRKSRRRSSAVKRPKLTTNQKMGMTFLVTLVLLTLVAALTKNPFKSKPPVPVASNHEKFLEEASVDELMIYAKQLARKENLGRDAKEDLPSRIKFIERQIEIMGRAEKLETASQGSLLQQIKLLRLELISRLNRLYLENGLGTIDKDDFNYVVQHLSLIHI